MTLDQGAPGRCDRFSRVVALGIDRLAATASCRLIWPGLRPGSAKQHRGTSCADPFETLKGAPPVGRAGACRAARAAPTSRLRAPDQRIAEAGRARGRRPVSEGEGRGRKPTSSTRPIRGASKSASLSPGKADDEVRTTTRGPGPPRRRAGESTRAHEDDPRPVPGGFIASRMRSETGLHRANCRYGMELWHGRREAAIQLAPSMSRGWDCSC